MPQTATKAFTLGFNSDQGYVDAKNVTTSDTVDLPSGASRGLFIGGAGNLRVITAGATTLTFTGVLAGTVLNITVTRVMATSTTCTNIVALY